MQKRPVDTCARGGLELFTARGSQRPVPLGLSSEGLVELNFISTWIGTPESPVPVGPDACQEGP